MKKISFISITIAVFLMHSCVKKESQVSQDNKKDTLELASLKDLYKQDFLIGAALNVKQIKDTSTSKEGAMIRSQFNSITAENNMKSMHVQPGKGEYTFEVADDFVDLGEQNNMFVVGHTLIWHSQLPQWVNDLKSKDELNDFFEDHIQTLVGRYKGRINGWDVVNEALNEDGTLRESIFLKYLGENYLLNAYKLAEAQDSVAELYYNDYNLCEPAKREGALTLVKQLKEKGAKVDGIGIQGHWGLGYPSLDEIEKSIVQFSELGVKVMITELDITVLPSPWDNAGADVNENAEGSDRMNPYPDGLPEDINEKLAQRYKDIFQLFIKHKDKISRVTFWGVNDRQSWKNNWPIRGRTDYTLLFDRENNAKKAFYEVVNLKK